MSINYTGIRHNLEKILENREGFANPKLFDTALRELTGMFCGFAYEHDISDDDVNEFLIRVRHHTITGINNIGKLTDVSHLINYDIRTHPLYELTEFALMHYRPGKVQAGPGEFFFCFYDASSEFGVDNHIGYDIRAGGQTIELKKLGSNFTTPDIFDHYASTGEVDYLLVVKPVSEAKTPKFRSKYSCIPVADWRKAFYHKEQSDGLLNLRLVNGS